MLNVTLVLITTLAVAHGAPQQQRQGAVAPDGHRGLGADTSLSDLLALVRSSKDEDRAFFAKLLTKGSEVRILVAGTAERYRSQGYFTLLPPHDAPTVEALHDTLAALDADALALLAKNDTAARVRARMLLDSRLRLRESVLDGWEFEAREVERGLAVLRGATDGYVELTQVEVSNIAARVDLAASLLRAVHNDMIALRPGATDPAAERDSEQAAERLVAAACASEGEGVRRAAVEREIALARDLAGRMSSALFTTRLVKQLTELLEWRSRVFEETTPLRDEALQWLPDSEQGADAPPQIAKLSRSDRMRSAAWRGRQGLAIDPLDEDLVWAAAHGTDFLNGSIESRPFYDRFLALRGIRAHDHHTYRGRDLDSREREALDLVQRSLLPPPNPARRL